MERSGSQGCLPKAGAPIIALEGLARSGLRAKAWEDTVVRSPCCQHCGTRVEGRSERCPSHRTSIRPYAARPSTGMQRGLSPAVPIAVAQKAYILNRCNPLMVFRHRVVLITYCQRAFGWDGSSLVMYTM